MNSGTRKTQFYQDRKVVLLVVLVALTILAWILHWNTGSGSTPTLAKTRRDTSGRVTSNSLEDPNLLSDRLGTQPPEFIDEKRNLFDFYQAAPPPPPPGGNGSAVESGPPPSVCGNQACEAGEDDQNCPSDCQPPPPPIPPITLRYIGYMAQKTGAVVFLTDGKEVYIGRVNDIIANKYRVLKISAENVELGYLNLNESRTIPFQGSQGG